MKLICSGKGEGRSRPPLFMFHDSTGLVEHFRSMSSTLTRVCYGIQLIDEAPLSSLQSLAGYYASVIHAAYPEGDVVLGGFSFGVLSVVVLPFAALSFGTAGARASVLETSRTSRLLTFLSIFTI